MGTMKLEFQFIVIMIWLTIKDGMRNIKRANSFTMLLTVMKNVMIKMLEKNAIIIKDCAD